MVKKLDWKRVWLSCIRIVTTYEAGIQLLSVETALSLRKLLERSFYIDNQCLEVTGDVE